MTDRKPSVTVVTLAQPSAAKHWFEMDGVERVVVFNHAAASGKRLGKLALGLGVDSIAVALKAAFPPRTEIYLATNPWIAVPLKVLTRRQVIVTGLYATPGTRSWKFLSTMLRESPIVTLASVEAANWRANGGLAASVLYGNDFPYSSGTPDPSAVMRIFVGGSSDRDPQLIERLEGEVLGSAEPVELVTAVGGSPRTASTGRSRVEHHGRVSQRQFGDLMASATVSFLPLVPRRRAAGHMILVGSLQVGTPVAFCGASGMDGYADGTYVREIDGGQPLLPQLRRFSAAAPNRASVVSFWHARFSRKAYVDRVSQAISELMGTPAAPSEMLNNS